MSSIKQSMKSRYGHHHGQQQSSDVSDQEEHYEDHVSYLITIMTAVYVENVEGLIFCA